MLEAHFQAAGFQDIATQRSGESADLAGIDLRDILNQKLREFGPFADGSNEDLYPAEA
jgi:hypothetical protein